jgi:hypothetical protein
MHTLDFQRLHSEQIFNNKPNTTDILFFKNHTFYIKYKYFQLLKQMLKRKCL